MAPLPAEPVGRHSASQCAHDIMTPEGKNNAERIGHLSFISFWDKVIVLKDCTIGRGV